MEWTVKENGTDGEILLTRVLDAPRTLVWNAWTDPTHFVHWFGPASVAVRNCRIDARPGGIIRFAHEATDASGLKVDVEGVFEEVVAPQQLVILFGFVDAAGQPATHPLVPDWPLHARLRTAVTFDERDGNTLLTIRQTVVPKEAAASAGVRTERGLAREGWAQTLDRLDTMIAGERGRA
jgi:uncharacterized protein YndB with AHSA1/START domain